MYIKINKNIFTFEYYIPYISLSMHPRILKIKKTIFTMKSSKDLNFQKLTTSMSCTTERKNQRIDTYELSAHVPSYP